MCARIYNLWKFPSAWRRLHVDCVMGKEETGATVPSSSAAAPAALVGAVPQYQSDYGVKEWLEILETFFQQNSIVNELEKTRFLILYGGMEIYTKLRILCAPETPNKTEFTKVRDKLVALLSTKVDNSVARQRFYSRKQKQGESVSDFALALKELSDACDFGNFMDTAVRDRFIYNLADPYISSMTIKAKKTTFEAAVSEAQTHELEILSKGRLEVNAFGQGRVQRKNLQRKFKSSPRNGKCPTCGRAGHKDGRECPAVTNQWECFYCHKKGHTRNVCRAKGRDYERKSNNANQMAEESENAASTLSSLVIGGLGESFEYCISSLKVDTRPPLIKKFKVNDHCVDCEIDTGACITVFTEQCVRRWFRELIIEPIEGKSFYNADGHTCSIVGSIQVKVNDVFPAQALVIKSEKESYPLIGRNWLEFLYPDWRGFFSDMPTREVSCKNILSLSLDNQTRVEKIKENFKEIFCGSSHPIKSFAAKIELKEGVKPVFLRPAVVPFALRDQVALQFREMESQGIIKYVEHSKWASQVVIVPKKNGKLRLCGNYKPTVNPRIHDNKYPMHIMDDIFCELAGFSVFCTLDLSGAFLQMALEAESVELTTINTHIGLFQFLRVPYGIKTAPAVFQAAMDKILRGIVGVIVYFDDIIIGGRSVEECEEKLRIVLERLREYNVQVNLEKCEFFKEVIEYLGHSISGEGISPSKLKTEAIQKATPPNDVTSVRSFLGLINFYGKFVPMLQSQLRPLHDLLKTGVRFEWSRECQEVFDWVKAQLLQGPLLVHFDPTKPITLVCDASPYGVGAVLNIEIDGVERPCYMMSSTLTAAERNYAQLHREALAIVAAVKKFHKFLYGQKVTVYTDCKSLESLLSGGKNLGTVINSRFLRWIIFLQNYDLEIKFRPKSQTANADALSRLPMESGTDIETADLSFGCFVNIFCENESELVNHEQIAAEIGGHPVLKEVLTYVLQGWPKSKCKENLKPFYNVRDSLDCQNGCLFYGDRVFIPQGLRPKILNLLHKEHVGMVKCKQLARKSVWWPKIDGDIENFVKSCSTCQVCADNRKQSSLVSWQKTTYPLERIHLDHFMFQNKIFLVIIDDFTKWVHVDPQKSTDTKSVIFSIKKFCANFGLPNTAVTDNGTAFTSSMFENFCKVNQIVHKTSPPYHPESNGLAEVYVKITKNNLYKYFVENKSNTMSIEEQLQNFLFKSHITPVNGDCPAQRMLGFTPKSVLSSLQKCKLMSNREKVKSPLENNSKVSINRSNNSNNKQGRDEVKSDEMFKSKQAVYVKWPNPGPENYVKGEIITFVTSNVYLCKLLEQGRVVKVHRDSIKVRETEFQPRADPQQVLQDLEASQARTPQRNVRPRPVIQPSDRQLRKRRVINYNLNVRRRL